MLVNRVEYNVWVPFGAIRGSSLIIETIIHHLLFLAFYLWTDDSCWCVPKFEASEFIMLLVADILLLWIQLWNSTNELGNFCVVMSIRGWKCYEATGVHEVVLTASSSANVWEHSVDNHGTMLNLVTAGSASLTALHPMCICVNYELWSR